MNEGEARKALIALWLKKAEEALASAKLELNAGHTNFAVNRLYYDRQESDYIPTAAFEASDISTRIQQTREFINLINGLIGNS